MSRPPMRTCWAVSVLLAAAGCVIESPDELPAERPPVLAVAVSPPNAVVEAGGSQQFTAAVSGNGTVPQAVVWSVRSTGQPAGTVDAQGVYRVLAPVAAQARDYVVATSLVNAGVEAVAAVDVPAFSFSIAPTTGDLLLGDSMQFTATVHGMASYELAWSCSVSVSSGGSPGTIDATGRYTAPAFPPPGAFINVEARLAGGKPTFAVAEIRLHLRPPVLNSASGPVVPGYTVTLFGSGFLAAAPGVQWQVQFEDTAGRFGGSNPFLVQDDRMLVQVPAGLPWSGRLRLAMWADSMEVVYSNLVDAGLP